MTKDILKVFIFISFFIVMPVSASNNVDYKLAITKDYNFKEVITYSLSNYKTIQGGNTYFDQIVGDDVYTDIEYKTKYSKSSYKSNGKYYVKLSHSYSEYGMGNANFLNNCFDDSKYDYDIDTIKFTSSGRFNCLNGDSLKITIVTDFDVIESNADSVSGNKYIWNPKGADFVMRISLKKVYEQKKNSAEYEDNFENAEKPSNGTDITPEPDKKQKQETEQSSVNPVVIGLIAFGVIVVGFLIFAFLRAKAAKNNSI